MLLVGICQTFLLNSGDSSIKTVMHGNNIFIHILNKTLLYARQIPNNAM